MTQPTTAPAETPSLAFRDGTDARTRADATELLTALNRGAQPFVRAFSLHGARAVERQGVKLYEFIGVSEGIKRDGSIVRVGGINFDGFDLNPVFLLAHDYTGLPIGRVVERRTEHVPGLGGAVKILVQSASALDLGAEQRDLVRSTFALYDAGFLNTVSFGWNVLQAEPLQDTEGRFSGFDFIRTDALEFSAVPVPADPQAGLQRAMELGLLKPEQVPYFVANHKRPMRSAVYSLREMPAPAPDPAAPTEIAAALEHAAAERATEQRPYKVEAEHAQCPASKPWGVVKADSGELMGCHENEGDAQAQMGALYANESAATADAVREVVPSDDEAPADDPPVEPATAAPVPEGPAAALVSEPTTERVYAQMVRDAVSEALASVPLMRKGAVLSAKNKTAITAAMTAMHDALSTLEDVMKSAMGDMGGDTEDMAETAVATPAVARTVEPEPIIPVAATSSPDDLDDIRARLEDLERNAPKQRRRYDDLLRETTRGQAAASRLRDKATRLGTSAPEK